MMKVITFIRGCNDFGDDASSLTKRWSLSRRGSASVRSRFSQTAYVWFFNLFSWQTVCSLLKRRWLVPRYAANEGCTE